MSDSNQKDLFDSSENSISKEEKIVTKKSVTKKKVKSTKQTDKTKLKTQVAQAKADQEAKELAEAKVAQDKADEEAKLAQAKADQEAKELVEAKVAQDKADEEAKLAQAKADQEAKELAEAKVAQDKADEEAKLAQAKADQEAKELAEAKLKSEEKAKKLAEIKEKTSKILASSKKVTADEEAKVAQAKADQEKADEEAKLKSEEEDKEIKEKIDKILVGSKKVTADEEAKVAQAKADQEKADEEAKLKSEEEDKEIKEKIDKILVGSKKVKELDESNKTDASDITEPSNKDDRFLVLTHRRNLLSIMSSGLIGPKEVYGKYRDDILVHTKGLVPLFSRSISSQLIDLTTSKRDSNFPVILELDREQIPDSFLFGVTFEGEILKNVDKFDSMVFRLTKDILSTNMIKEVHFISEENLSDFRDRMFENVPIEDFNLSESPRIFESKTTFPVEFFENIDNYEFNNIDRISRISDKVASSIALLSENMEREDDLMLLYSMLSFPYKNITFRMEDSYSTFADLISSLVVGESENKNHSSEYYLLSATLEELIYHSPNEGWVALDFLEKVESRFKSSIQDDDDHLETYFEACKKIFNSQMDIQDGLFSDEKNHIQRAVMLFLLRPDYEDLVGRENSQLKPGYFVKKIAILITGFRVGYERIGIQFKGFHHQIFAPLRSYIINFGLGNRSDNFEKQRPKSMGYWDPAEEVYTYKHRLLKETITGKIIIKSYINDVIQKMLDQGHIHEDYEIITGTLNYRFEYLESGSKRKQPVNLDFDSVQDKLIISSPCFEITKSSHQKRITKVILEKIFAKDYDGKAYWIFEDKSITLKRVIHHDQIANIDIVDLINFIAKTADEVEEKFFKQDRVR